MMNAADELLDLKRRHSGMHIVDKECCKAMAALIEMQKVCQMHGLDDSLNDVYAALQVLHRRAKQCWQEGK